MRLPKQYAKILFELTKDVKKENLEAALHEFIVFLQREQALGKVEYIVSAFEAYANERAGISRLTVRSTRPLEKKEVSEIHAVFGSSAVVDSVVEPPLLGGLVIKTSDTIIDGSLRMQLRRLQEALNR